MLAAPRWIAPLLFLVPVAAAQDLITFTRVDTLVGIHEPERPTYGPAVGDYDGDGYHDVFIANHHDYPTLYHNETNGTFTLIDLTTTGINSDGDHHGVAWADYNNDGWLDFYIAVGAHMGTGCGHNPLYYNHQNAHFCDVSTYAGTADSLGRGRYVLWFDANNDGRLDLLVLNYLTQNQLFMNVGDGTFSPRSGAGGLFDPEKHVGACTLWNDDRYMDVILSSLTTGDLSLYRNNQHGWFADVADSAGLPPRIWHATSFAWFDYDNDGDQDFYVSRGGSSTENDALYSDSTAVLMNMKLPASPDLEDGLDGIAIEFSAVGLLAEFQINYDNWPYDQIFLGPEGNHPSSMPFFLPNGAHLGRPDFVPGEVDGCFIWQEAGNEPFHVHCSTDFGDGSYFGARFTPVYGSILSVETVGVEVPLCTIEIDDRLYGNLGNGTFADVSSDAGIGDESNGRSAIPADFNNDGWMDLYVVSARHLSGLIAYNEPNLLYLNNADGTFTECAVACGADGQVPGIGSSAAWLDYDHNGFPDLYITNGDGTFPFNRGPHVLLRNGGNANHWIVLRLEGTSSNRNGIGARLVLAAEGMTQVRVQNGAARDASQSAMDVHFGLGTAATIDSLAVYWPSGIVDVYTNLAVDEYHILVETPLAAVPEPKGAGREPSLQAHFSGADPQAARIRYWLPRETVVRLEVYDALGRRVAHLQEGRQSAGRHTVDWDAPRNPAGVYWAQLRADGWTRTCRVLLAN